MARNPLIETVFDAPRALVGMTHSGALPGTQRASQSVEQLADATVEEACTLQADAVSASFAIEDQGASGLLAATPEHAVRRREEWLGARVRT